MMPSKRSFLLPAAVLTVAALAQAGGFWLQLGNPDASSEARDLKAVITVKAVGCHEPDKAEVTGRAIAVVNGKRQEIPLKLVKMSTPGMFAVAKQWPGDDTWTVELIGHNAGMTTSMLVNTTGTKFDRASAKFIPGIPAAADVEQLVAKR